MFSLIKEKKRGGGAGGGVWGNWSFTGRLPPDWGYNARAATDRLGGSSIIIFPTVLPGTWRMMPAGITNMRGSSPRCEWDVADIFPWQDHNESSHWLVLFTCVVSFNLIGRWFVPTGGLAAGSPKGVILI